MDEPGEVALRGRLLEAQRDEFAGRTSEDRSPDIREAAATALSHAVPGQAGAVAMSALLRLAADPVVMAAREALALAHGDDR